MESYYNLSLQVKDRKGIEDSLLKMTEGTIINDYRCDHCNQKVDVEKRSLIAETPNVLMINLQRIIFNFDTFQNDKINTRFEFPDILNLKDFSFKSVMTAEKRDVMQEESVRHLMEMDDDEYIYKLVGVTIHVGTAEHGHYYSLINTSKKEDSPRAEWVQVDKDHWKQFDDETVKYYNYNDLKVDSFGGYSGNNLADNELNAYLVHSGTANSYGKNAYMLVYEKMKKKPLQEVIIQGESTPAVQSTAMNIDGRSTPASLECADTATSRAALPPDEESQIKYIPFNKIEPYVPDWIKN